MVTSNQMNAAWEGLNRTWRERMERLEEAMTASVQYQDALQVGASEAAHVQPGSPEQV